MNMEWMYGIGNTISIGRARGKGAGKLLKEMNAGERVILSQDGRDIKMQADRDAEG